MRYVWLALAWPIVTVWNLWAWWCYDLDDLDRWLAAVTLMLVALLFW